MKRVFIILVLLILLTGCKPEQYTNIEPITGFIVLENGNVEFTTLSDNGIGTMILEFEQIYSYDGESKIIITSYDYYNVYAYLNKDDFEKLQEQMYGKV